MLVNDVDQRKHGLTERHSKSGISATMSSISGPYCCRSYKDLQLAIKSRILDENFLSKISRQQENFSTIF